MDGCGWMDVDIYGYLCMDMDICGWMWMSVDGCGWMWISVDIGWNVGYLMEYRIFDGLV